MKSNIRIEECVCCLAIDHFHVTSLLPCWRMITKDSSLASIVTLSNIAAMSLSFDYLGIDCKTSIIVHKILMFELVSSVIQRGSVDC